MISCVGKDHNNNNIVTITYPYLFMHKCTFVLRLPLTNLYIFLSTMVWNLRANLYNLHLFLQYVSAKFRLTLFYITVQADRYLSQ